MGTFRQRQPREPNRRQGQGWDDRFLMAPAPSFPAAGEALPSHPQMPSEVVFPPPRPFLPAGASSSSSHPLQSQPPCRTAVSFLPTPPCLSSQLCPHPGVTYLLASTQQLHFHARNSQSSLLLPILLPSQVPAPTHGLPTQRQQRTGQWADPAARGPPPCCSPCHREEEQETNPLESRLPSVPCSCSKNFSYSCECSLAWILLVFCITNEMNPL